MTPNKEDILRHIPLFENISKESRAALAYISIPKIVKKKEPLFWEGDKGLSIYILVKGNIRLFKTTSEGKEVIIKVVKPGEMFAEVVLFEQSRYPVSAVALKESLVFMISKHQFTCLLENESFRKDFISNVMKKLRYLTDQIQFLMNHDVEDRFFMFIEEQYGKKERIVSSLSKKDVAAAIGATPETLSRLLHRLKNEGKVDWTGSDLHINWNAQ